jgi:hypothetical protein
MPIDVEARDYAPGDVTAELRDALAARLTMRPDGIIIWREVPRASLTTIKLFLEIFRERTMDIASYSLVVDIAGTSIPNSATREALGKFFRGEREKARLNGLAYVTGKNFIINAAARFVAASIGVRPVTVSRDLSEALQALGAK